MYGRLESLSKTYRTILSACESNVNNVDFFFSSDNSSIEVVQNTVQLLNPVNFDNCEKKYCHQWETYNTRTDVNSTNMYKHFANVKKVFELMLDNCKNYDVVLITRADLYFYSNFNFTIPYDNIFIPEGSDYFGINDQCAWGSKEKMQIYANLIDNVHTFITNGIQLNPEILLKEQLKNFVIKRTKRNYCFKCECTSLHKPV